MVAGNGVRLPERLVQRSSQHMVAQSGNHLSSHRSSPALPPIRNLHALGERPDDKFLSRANGHTHVANHGARDGDGLYASRGPLIYSQSHHRGNAYLSGTSSLPAEYSNYGQAEYQSTQRHGSYPGSYNGVEGDYGSNAMDESPHANFDSMSSGNRRRRGNLPKPVTDILRAWFHEHLDHPYPSEEDKQIFLVRTGLTIQQVRQRNGPV